MDYELKLKQLKADEAAAKPQPADPGVTWRAVLDVAWKLSIVILASGAVGSAGRDVVRSVVELAAMILEVLQ